MSFVYFDADNDENLVLNFSPQFITYLAKQGFTLGEKLGQGASSVAYEAATDGDYPTPIVLLITPWDPWPRTVRMKQISKMTGLGEETSAVIRIYDFAVYEGPLSDHIELNTQPQTTMIQILERVPQTLAEYVFEVVRHESVAFKAMFVMDIYTQLRALEAELAKFGYYYSNILKDNIGFTANKRCVFIDLESIHELESIHPEVSLELINVVPNFIKYDLLDEPEDEEAFEFEELKRWKLVGGIANDKKESLALLSAFSAYVAKI